MSAVKDCADRNREGAGAIATLPALITTVSTDVPPYVSALAIRANRVSMPPRLLKMVNGLFVGLEGLEKFEDVHGCTVSFDALPYLNPRFCQVQKRTIPFFFSRFRLLETLMLQVGVGDHGHERAPMQALP